MRTSTLTEAREKEDARVTAVAEFTLPAELEAHAPPEARGLPRDGVRMLLSRTASGAVTSAPGTAARRPSAASRSACPFLASMTRA